MPQTTITIQGQQRPVVFTMKTIMNFEEIADKSFFGTDFNHLSDRIALVAAAIFAADKDADITVEGIMGDEGWDATRDIISAFTKVMKLSEQFFHIPAVEPADPKEPEGDDAPAIEEDKPKN